MLNDLWQFKSLGLVLLYDHSIFKMNGIQINKQSSTQPVVYVEKTFCN